mmetsp:Transcript_10352/g.30280  ORF Transcript_10352/g.30280 Transcript_10352/m.30280 type:complete len:201 (+) Transcript_10352:163-765(+)
MVPSNTFRTHQREMTTKALHCQFPRNPSRHHQHRSDLYSPAIGKELLSPLLNHPQSRCQARAPLRTSKSDRESMSSFNNGDAFGNTTLILTLTSMIHTPTLESRKKSGIPNRPLIPMILLRVLTRISCENKRSQQCHEGTHTTAFPLSIFDRWEAFSQATRNQPNLIQYCLRRRLHCGGLVYGRAVSPHARTTSREKIRS